MSSSNSAFKLSTNDKKTSRRLFRNKRKGYRYAIKCEINFDNLVTYNNSIIAYAEYYIYFIIRKKYNTKIKWQVHIFDISDIYVNDRDSIEIYFSYHVALISSPGLDKFMHILYRVITYCTKFLRRKMIFSTYNSFSYPKFDPNISVSQQFQMCYIAFCFYYQQPYFHDLVLFFHRIITTENVILDLTYLPCHILTSSKIERNFSIEPFLKTISNFDHFVGITCKNCYIPKILKQIAPLLNETSTIRFITLTNVGITSGAKDIANSIKTNSHLNLISIDLSGNHISDLEHLTEALRYLKNPLYSLNLSNCNLSKKATENLCISLMLNPNLKHLKHFEITGAKMSSKAMVIFSNYFHQTSASLYRIHLGKTDYRINALFKEINSIQQNNLVLESFSLSGTDLRSISIEQLKIFLCGTKSLKELDISSTNLSINEIIQVIHLIGQNDEITQFALHLNGLNLNGNSLKNVLHAFDERGIKKWITLSFENNGLVSNDLENLLRVLNRMNNLITLNIGLNFSERTESIESYLPNILSLSKLERLSLRGSDKCYMTFDQIDPFVTSLSSLPDRAIRLNVKDNRLGNIGYRDMKNLILAKKLIELQIDGNYPDSLVDIINLCEVARDSIDMNLMNFPYRDVQRLLNKFSKVISADYLSDFELKRRLMLEKLQMRLARHGIHSVWTLNGISEIEEVVDHQTKIFHSYLKKNITILHTLGSRTLGIPVPFINLNDNLEDKIEKVVSIHDPQTINIYRIYKALYDYVEEKTPENKEILFNYLSYKNSELCENAYNMLSDCDYSSKSRKLNGKLFSGDDEEQKTSLDYSGSKTKSDENQNNVENENCWEKEHVKQFNTNSGSFYHSQDNMLFDSNYDSYDHFT